jgi:CRP/FNR family cyclic AMP-dependent transcriptional regulator
MEDNLELLQKTMLFKGSSAEELQLASELFQERLIKSNTVIFTEKMSSEALYIVKSGTVRISVMDGKGDEKSLFKVGPGEYFGELALLQEGYRMVTARSETAVELLLITRKDFQKLMDQDPRTASRMLSAIATLFAMRVKVYTPRLKEMLLA